MTHPDFKQWSKNVLLLASANSTLTKEIETALKQAFEQGYHYGLNSGWAVEQENERMLDGGL